MPATIQIHEMTTDACIVPVFGRLGNIYLNENEVNYEINIDDIKCYININEVNYELS